MIQPTSRSHTLSKALSLPFISVVALAASTAVVSAMEISADYHVPLTPENAILGYFSPTKKPVISVPSGAIVSIDGGGGVNGGGAGRGGAGAATATPGGAAAAPGAATKGYAQPKPTVEGVNAWLKQNGVPGTVADYPALMESIKVMNETVRPPEVRGGHLLVGPVYVEGAEPGDTLEVRILDVSPRIPFGTVGGNPGGGALPDVTPRPFRFCVHLDLKRNAGVFQDGTGESSTPFNVEVPLAPFMGVMATCPDSSEGAFRGSGPPGNFGGNLDCKYLTAGSTLYLPVFQKGGLFYTGDSHAAQGNGEVTVNAIETANTCTLQFIVHKGKTLKMPRAETATHYLTFGLDPDLNKAMHQAILETVDFLKEKQGYDFFQAYALASIGVDFVVTQDVDKTNGINGLIPKRLFIHDTNPYWYRPY